jgi:hypothetical protein
MTEVEETLRIKIGKIEVFFTHSIKGLLGFNSIHSFKGLIKSTSRKAITRLFIAG